MEPENTTLAYWNIRSFVEPIRMIMEHLHITFIDIEHDLDKLQPLNVSATQWAKLKEALTVEFDALPTLKGVESISVTHTVGICRYLAQKYRPKMLGSAMNEYAEVDAVLFICHDMRIRIMNAYEKGWEKCGEDAMKFVKEKLGYLNKFMKSRSWISGKQATVADFILCELLEFIQSLDESTLDTYPNCKKLLRKLYAIPEVSKYKVLQEGFDIAKYIKLPFKGEP